jgi:hypothetical protein
VPWNVYEFLGFLHINKQIQTIKKNKKIKTAQIQDVNYNANIISCILTFFHGTFNFFLTNINIVRLVQKNIKGIYI